MRRYRISAESAEQGAEGAVERVHLVGETLHHIRDVCRQSIGDRFEVLLDGTAYLVEIESESKRESVAKVIQARAIAPLPYPRLRLAILIPRFNVFETVIEKMVELGVECIQPLFGDHSFIRTATETWQAKTARFEKIVLAATQQCGRGERMAILPARSLSEFLNDWPANRSGRQAGLFAYEGEAAPLGEVAPQVAGAETVWLFIGGEGGFSTAEVQRFRELGLVPTTLGEQVLRVETACVALVSVLKYECGLMV